MPIPPQELAKLVDRHWAPLIVWAIRRGTGRSFADDIVQQAFVRLAKAAPVPENPAGWLYTVTRNLAINHQVTEKRRAARQREVARREASESNISLNIEVDELLKRLDKLPDAMREIVVARIWGGFNFDEIGTMVGVSKASAWRSYKSAIKKLQELYGLKDEVIS